MNIQKNISNNETIISQDEERGEIVYASMKDIFHILDAISKEGVPPQHELEESWLMEQYYHSRTIGGNFKYDSHYVGPWIIEKIKQYRPKPKKNTDIFYS